MSEPLKPTEPLAEALKAGGFDVFTPMSASWYNDYLRRSSLATDEDHVGGKAFSLSLLPDYGRGGDTLALLIGNSRAMWPSFLSWLHDQPDDVANPVDTFTSQVIGRAVSEFAGSVKHDIFWASDFSPERLVDMNRASLVSGLCYFSEEMFLSIHPTFGSWVAFRAVVVLDMPASHLGEPPAHLPPLLSGEEETAARAAFAEAMEASSKVELTCDGMPPQIAHKWAAMRDCVGLGREHKYSALQSEYHYTKDRSLLRRAMDEEGGDGVVAAAPS